MGRPKKNAKPQHVEPESESQDVEEQEALEATEPDEEPEPVNGKAKTKADACRAALAAGIDNAERAMGFTRSRFGIEIKPTDFTLYKSKSKKQGGAATKAKPSRKPQAAVEGYLAPPPKPQPVDEQSDLLATMEAMKPLVASLGADKVHRIVDLLG